MKRLFRHIIGLLKHKFHRCSKDGCWRKGEPYFLPDNDGTNAPDDYCCWVHAHELGYCSGCRQFWAGVNSFDFSKSHLCENCAHEADMDECERCFADDFDYGDFTND